MNKPTCFLMILLIISLLPACKSGPAQTQAPAQPSPQALMQSTPEPTPAPEVVTAAPTNFKKTFVGTIGDNLAVQMDIERNGAKITGNYFYDKPGAWNLADKLLDLNGKVDKDGNVTLNESSYEGDTGKEKLTGTFKGKLDAVTSNNLQALRLAGTWTGAKDKKPLAVNLKEQTFDLGGLQLADKKLKDGGKKVRYEIASRLPQLTGEDAAKAEKFNKTVNNFVAKRTGEFKKTAIEMIKEEADAAKTTAPPPAETKPEEKPEAKPEAKPESPAPAPAALRPYAMDVSYTVTAAGKDFISILFYFYEDTGGAHPNTTTASFNYDINRGEALKLADLFTMKANYLKVISDYCIKELKKLKTVDSADEGASAKLENFDSWNIAPSGLRITFDRYQVAAYAAGDHEVVVPYSVLKPIIKPDGMLAPYAK
ncbi:MAG: DUF3298 and DUF4163 domain-containing protein [Blastocatellia bacterium]